MKQLHHFSILYNTIFRHMFGLPPTLIIWDTEYTTWEGARERNWNRSGEHRELVQIGAIKVDTRTLTETDSFEIFIKPHINPILSDFFIKLTGITQGTLDAKGTDFAIAWKNFKAWMGDDLAYAFGSSDLAVVKENCKLYNVLLMANEARFRNICDIFEKYGVQTDQYHSSTIVRAFDKEPLRGAHNALNDARSMLDGLVLLNQKVTANQKTVL